MNASAPEFKTSFDIHQANDGGSEPNVNKAAASFFREEVFCPGKGAGAFQPDRALNQPLATLPEVDLVGLKSLPSGRGSDHELLSKAQIDPLDLQSLISRLELPFGGNGSKKKGVNLTEIEKPDKNLPDPWEQPPAADFHGLWQTDGKCGVTGVANMLRFYGIEKSPSYIYDANDGEYRSYGIGMRMDKFADDLTKLSGKKFSAHTVDGGSDAALKVLRDNIGAGKPVAIMYDGGTPHWVVVTGITGGENPEITLQSWGKYQKVKWNDIKDAWKIGHPGLWGDYPYVVGDEASPNLPKKK